MAWCSCLCPPGVPKHCITEFLSSDVHNSISLCFIFFIPQYPVPGGKNHFEMSKKVNNHVYALPEGVGYNFTDEARSCLKKVRPLSTSECVFRKKTIAGQTCILCMSLLSLFVCIVSEERRKVLIGM